MNKKSILALAGFAMAFTQVQARVLWSLDETEAPMYEVQVPAVVDGSCGGPSACAGWWFGYGAEGGTWDPKNADATGSLMTTDTADGSLIPNGNLVEGEGLYINLHTIAATATDKPSIAGLGFNYAKPEGPVNIEAFGGYIITYKSTGELHLELGWDEATYNYDTWYAILDAAPAYTTANLPWAAFDKDAWGTGTKNQPIATATTMAYSMKIRLKNGSAAAKDVTLYVKKLETVAGTTPGAISSVSAKNTLKANLVGRTLNFSGLGKKFASVEVISVQGQVVAKQIVNTSASSIDLSKVGAGVFVVKATGKGLNLNKMIAIK